MTEETCRIDLHVHSQISDDGEWPVADVLLAAQQRGIEILAITDHNRIAGAQQAALLAADYGIRLISGVEIDCRFEQTDLHLLGYFIDLNDPGFEALYQQQVQQEALALPAKLRGLAQYGWRLDIAALRAQAGARFVTGEMIAEALLQDPALQQDPVLQPYRPGGARSDNPLVNFYWDFLAQGRPCHVSIPLPSLAEAVALVRRGGGVPVLAHPGINIGANPEWLEPILATGIAGIEVYNNYHTPEQMQFYADKARQHDLAVTCGSDFHGKIKPAIALGQCRCPLSADTIVQGLLAARFQRQRNTGVTHV